MLLAAVTEGTVGCGRVPGHRVQVGGTIFATAHEHFTKFAAAVARKMGRIQHQRSLIPIPGRSRFSGRARPAWLSLYPNGFTGA